MREVKFRAWVKSPGIMREVLGYHFNNKEYYLKYENDTNIMCSKDKVELMEYTGVKDIEGIEIYEGDIVEYFNDSVGNIRYIEGAFIIDGQFGYDILCEMGGKIKVVGNVFENSDLLDL